VTPAVQASELLTLIAAHGLPGPPPAWPGAPPSDGEWESLHRSLGAEKLTGFAVWALEDGLVLTEPQATELVEAHAQGLVGCLHLDQFLLEVTDLLGRVDIVPWVLKGPSLARRIYPDPAVRLYGDVDLLISSADWDRALAALRRAGFHQVYGEPRPGWARQFAKGTVLHTDPGWELDLHRTFVRGPFGLAVVLDDVLADPVTLDVGGRPLQALPLHTSFLHACFNAALGDVPPRLVAVRDVAQHLASGDVDTERVLVLARRWRAEAVVARAVGLIGDLLAAEGLPLQAWARSHGPGWWDRLAMVGYSGPRRTTSRESVLGLLAIRGVRARFDYAWPLLFPQSSYIEGRHAGRIARFRHAASGLWTRR
jgi:hypothetical protein